MTIGHTSRRASWVLLLAAAVVVCAFGGTALALRNSLSIKPPTNAKVGKNFSFTISGFAGRIEGLSYFVDPKACGPSPHIEHYVHKAKGSEDVVNASFNKTVRGWRISKAGTYRVCAYLVLISRYGLYTSNGVLARTGKAFTVR